MADSQALGQVSNAIFPASLDLATLREPMNRILFGLFQIVFQFLSRLFPAAPVSLHERSFQRILVFSAAGIGDTLTDSVAIKALKQSFPRAWVGVVTHRRRASLARHNPFADEVILYHKSFLRFFSLGFYLRGLKPEVVVMLRGNDPDLWPLAWCVNRHALVSCPVMTRFGFLISHPVSIPAWENTHGVEQTLKIVRFLGSETRDPTMVYAVRDEERNEVRRTFARWGVSSHLPLVVFQVGGGRRSSWRDWPVHYFSELGQRLLKNYHLQLILLGGKDLQEKAALIQSSLPKEVVNLAGCLTLEESAALLSLSKILVSTDTGIMHLGFAVGVDTLALIHCNNPATRVGPYGYGDKHLVAELQPPIDVQPSKEVNMNLLTPKEVWPKLQELCHRHALQPPP